MDVIARKKYSFHPKNDQFALLASSSRSIFELMEYQDFTFTDGLKDSCRHMQQDELSTLMEKAIEFNHLDIVIYLIDNKYVDIHATYGFMERTALMLAASQGKSSIIEALLSRPDTDLNAQDIQGNTAFMLATHFCKNNQLSAADAEFINLFLKKR